MRHMEGRKATTQILEEGRTSGSERGDCSSLFKNYILQIRKRDMMKNQSQVQAPPAPSWRWNKLFGSSCRIQSDPMLVSSQDRTEILHLITDQSKPQVVFPNTDKSGLCRMEILPDPQEIRVKTSVSRSDRVLGFLILSFPLFINQVIK